MYVRITLAPMMAAQPPPVGGDAPDSRVQVGEEQMEMEQAYRLALTTASDGEL